MLIAMVFMFNSTAVFAKALEVEMSSGEQKNINVLKRLERRLKRENKRKRKSSLEKEVTKHKRIIEISYKKATKRIRREVPIGKQEEAFEKLENLRLYNLRYIDDLKSISATYEDFLRNLIIEFSLNSDPLTGRFYESSAQSAQLTVLGIVGLSVLGVIAVVAVMIFLLTLILWWVCEATDC